MNWYILWLKIKCKLFKKHHWEDHITFLKCRFCPERREFVTPRHVNCRCFLCNTIVEHPWSSGEEETKSIIGEMLNDEKSIIGDMLREEREWSARE